MENLNGVNRIRKVDQMESYFVGIRLPKELEEEWETWRRQFRAPRTVPHITLIPPFQWEQGQEELLDSFRNMLYQLFGLRRRSGSFGTAVLFVNVSSILP